MGIQVTVNGSAAALALPRGAVTIGGSSATVITWSDTQITVKANFAVSGGVKVTAGLLACQAT